jgi:hypothetical protein
LFLTAVINCARVHTQMQQHEKHFFISKKKKRKKKKTDSLTAARWQFTCYTYLDLGPYGTINLYAVVSLQKYRRCIAERVANASASRSDSTHFRIRRGWQ